MVTQIFWIANNLLIEKTTANRHSDIFLRILHDICKIKLTFRYLSYIYISYQMYKSWSCVTFYHSWWNRFPQANDNRISTSSKWFNMEVYTRSSWFYFELIFLNFPDFYEKSPCKKEKVGKNCFDEQEKSLTYLKMLRKKHKNFKATLAVLGHSEI